jgi:predicted permease
MRLELLSTLWQDVRYGLRLLAKTPGFTAIAVLMLALGIGANTAIFSLIDAIMFRALPVQDAQKLVLLQWSANKTPGYHWYSGYGDTKTNSTRNSVNPWGTQFSFAFLKEVEKSGVFDGVAAFAGGGGLAMSGNGPTVSLSGQTVNGDFFRTLGVRPAAGRLLQPSDDQPNSAPVVVLNYGYWQRQFGGSKDVVGKVVNINGVPFSIVGVAEQKFNSLALGNVYELWYPIAMAPRMNPLFLRRQNDAGAWWALIAARIKPGTSRQQAQAAVEVLFRNHVLHTAAGDRRGEKMLSTEADAPRISLLNAQDALVGSSVRYTDPLRVLMVAVGIVLLIACANVAGLVLSRATARKREIAVRLALGARRARLLRQLLTESVLLAVMGGVLGVVFAWWGAKAILHMAAGNAAARPLGFTASIDARVLAFTAAVSLLTGIVAGLAPALRSLRLDLTPSLKEGTGASATAGRSEARQRWFSVGNGLVVAQAALAVVVLMGAGLLVHTLTNLENMNPGFDTRNTLTFSLNPSLAGYKQTQIDNLYRDLQQNIGGLPGVQAVSYSESALLAGSWSRSGTELVPPGSTKKVTVEFDWMPVGMDFFTTLKIPILMGRSFNSADFQQAAARNEQDSANRAKPANAQTPPTIPQLVVVNQAFVRKHLQGVNPVGYLFGANDGSNPELPDKSPGYMIVGVCGDAKYNSLRREIDPTMYVPLSGGAATFEVRTAGDPRAIVPAIRNLIAQRDNNLPMTRIATQTEQIELLLTQERLLAKLCSFFGVLALLLACVGLYGLLSYDVARRTREIGIRMALGARRADLLRLVVWQGIVLALVGTAIGIAGAFGIGRLLKTMLYGVAPSDPVAFAGAIGLLVLVALIAAFVPARRATNVDPMVALRYE